MATHGSANELNDWDVEAEEALYLLCCPQPGRLRRQLLRPVTPTRISV